MNTSAVGTLIRVPATANLMIDSQDRRSRSNSGGSPWDFSIQKNQSIFNGFFTRIGATEVVLEWDKFNIVIGKNNTLIFAQAAAPTSVTVTLTEAFYTVADVLDACVVQLNDATVAARYAVQRVDGIYGIVDTTGVVFTAVTGTLAPQMNFTAVADAVFPVAPDLRPYRYIDFISSQLTYNQNLKDATTSSSDQNVLVRWYMSYDNPVPSDQYGFPVLMGYQPFNLRRLYNPPKQIAWENNMPIGQLAFQVVDPTGVVVTGNGDWLMTLQVSEN